MTVTSAWTVTDGGTPYTAKETGSKINYRCNHPSDAVISFDNSAGTYNTVFTPEDEVTIKIGSTTMMVGYIYNIEDILYPGRRKDLNLYIMDSGSYVSSKTIFERNYYLTKYAKDLFIDGITKINTLYSSTFSSSGVDSTGLGTTNFAVKGRSFQGTYVKDVWYAAAEVGGADFFVDETKTLQAWPFETTTGRRIQNAGTNYKIVDYVPTHNYELLARLDKFNQSWSNDAQNRYRSVKVINGIEDTYPGVIDQGSVGQYSVPNFAYPKSSWWYNNQLDSYFDAGPGNVPVRAPYVFNQTEQTLGIPSIYIYVGSTAATVKPTFQPQQKGLAGINAQLMQQQYNNWQTIGFFLNLNPLTGQTINNCRITLVTNSTGAFWYLDLNAAELAAVKAGWTYLEWLLPSSRTVADANWTPVQGSATDPLYIDYVWVAPTHGTLDGTGFTVGSYVGLANFNLWRIMGDTETDAGSPTTQKIIVNRNLIQDGIQPNTGNTEATTTMLKNFATRELLRTDVNKQGPVLTIDGNTNFRQPGYKVDIDFTASMGTGRSATDIRIDEIEHVLESGFHYTKLTFDSSFYRP